MGEERRIMGTGVRVLKEEGDGEAVSYDVVVGCLGCVRVDGSGDWVLRGQRIAGRVYAGPLAVGQEEWGLTPRDCKVKAMSG
jgi:hypothetical protein